MSYLANCEKSVLTFDILGIAVVRPFSEDKLLFAVDPSLTASGWALFALSDGLPLCAGIISPPGPHLPLSERLSILQEAVEQTFLKVGLRAGDILVCEGPAPLVLNPDSAVKVEQVRSIFETVARSKRVSVPGRVNPRTVQVELLGMRGKQLERPKVKAWARETAARLFPESLSQLTFFGERSKSGKLPQDVVDALLIGSVAISKLRLSVQLSVEPSQLFEVKTRKNNSVGRGNTRWSEKDLRKVGVRS